MRSLARVFAVLLLPAMAAAQVDFSDDFESYPVGSSIDGLGGWEVNTLAPTGLPLETIVDGADAITGRSLRITSRDVDRVDRIEQFSFPMNGSGAISMDVEISVASSIFEVQILDPLGFLILGGRFDANGQITGTYGFGARQATTGTWTPGTTHELTLEVLPNETINLYLDGQMIWTETSLGGSDIGEMYIICWNNDGGDNTLGATMTIDNIASGPGMPTPTMLPATATATAPPSPTPNLPTPTPTVEATATSVATSTMASTSPTSPAATATAAASETTATATVTATSDAPTGGGGCAACGAGWWPAIAIAGAWLVGRRRGR